MATCTVSFTVGKGAETGSVEFVPLGNQIIDNVLLDTKPVPATVTGVNTYEVVLQQGARYRLKSAKVGGSARNAYYFGRGLLTVSTASTANLYDLLDDVRTA